MEHMTHALVRGWSIDIARLVLFEQFELVIESDVLPQAIRT